MRLEAFKLLHDAIRGCREVETFTRGRAFEDFVRDIALQRATERSLEIIGEAMRRLRDVDLDVFDRIPDGHRVIGLRNVLAHGYDSLNYKVLWDAAVESVPSLRIGLEELMASVDSASKDPG